MQVVNVYSPPTYILDTNQIILQCQVMVVGLVGVQGFCLPRGTYPT